MLRLVGHKSMVFGLAFSRDGRTLASASGDSTVRLWDLSSGQERLRLDSSFGAARCVALSPDGVTVAAGYNNGAVQWWDLRQPDRAVRSEPQDAHCFAMHFSKTGGILYTAGRRSVLSHNLQLGNAVKRFSIRLDVGGFDLDRLGRPVVITQAGRIERLDQALQTSQKLLRVPILSEYGAELKADPAGDGFAFAVHDLVGCWNGTVRDKPIISMRHEPHIYSVCYTADGRSLLTCDSEGMVKRWDATNLAELATFDFGIGECYSLAVAPDGLTAAVGGLEDIVVWDLEQN